VAGSGDLDFVRGPRVALGQHTRRLARHLESQQGQSVRSGARRLDVVRKAVPALIAVQLGLLLAGCGAEESPGHLAQRRLAVNSVAMNGIGSACDQTTAMGFDLLCPTWLPGGDGNQWAGEAVGGVDRCSYLVSILGSSSSDSVPFHVMFGGRCRRFSLVQTRTGRWPAKPNFASYLGLIGHAPPKPSRQQDLSPHSVKVLERTTVGSSLALLLQIPDYPNAGIQEGHYAIVWNRGNDGYELSFHYQSRAQHGLPPTPAEIEALRRAANEMTKPLP